MIDFRYLYQGICGLANAHKTGTMGGHLGAAVAAGYFFGEDQSELADLVYRGIEGELDRVVAGEEAIWFNAEKLGVTPTELFKPFPNAEPNNEFADTGQVETAIQGIAEALSKNVGSLKQSGHNVIFGSIAIRALRDHPDYVTTEIVDGIRKLIKGFDRVSAGRGYFGKERGWQNAAEVKLPQDKGFAVYSSIFEMVMVTVNELIHTASVRKQGFGGMWHLINHAAAITQLHRYGYKELASLALPAHRQHVRLWRVLPDLENELGPVIKSVDDPRNPEYWMGTLKRDQARLTHRIKTLYGFYTLMDFIEDVGMKRQAEDALLYLMA